jgi:hypothetical protein
MQHTVFVVSRTHAGVPPPLLPFILEAAAALLAFAAAF